MTNIDGQTDENARQIAEMVRDACLRAARDAYEEAGFSGLCADGRWECAVAALRRLDLGPFLAEWARERGAPEPSVTSGAAEPGCE